MKKMKYFNRMRAMVLPLMVSLLLFSCAKERPEEIVDDSDIENPEITFNKSLQSLYSLGSEVVLDVGATDNDTLASLSVRVTNTSIDSIYLHVFETMLAPEIHILDTVIVNLTTMMADFEVLVEAEDLSGNKAAVTKNFHVMN